jgi:hypothetical protein
MLNQIAIYVVSVLNKVSTISSFFICAFIIFLVLNLFGAGLAEYENDTEKTAKFKKYSINCLTVLVFWLVVYVLIPSQKYMDALIGVAT